MKNLFVGKGRGKKKGKGGGRRARARGRGKGRGDGWIVLSSNYNNSFQKKNNNFNCHI